jgi:hypothetical protein
MQIHNRDYEQDSTNNEDDKWINGIVASSRACGKAREAAILSSLNLIGILLEAI